MITERFGFMQGRLSPMVDNKIQAFPTLHWETEFRLAEEHGWNKMEWTLDADNLYDNPLMTKIGQEKIKILCHRYGVTVPSLTGDCFMQSPFFKASGEGKEKLLDDLNRVIEASAVLGITYLVFPLVDNGHIQSEKDEEVLLTELTKLENDLILNKQKIIFESDFAPQALQKFINQFSPKAFGINYDIGNSASLGFDALAEMDCYGERIDNVHIKDRKHQGTTVPLGAGSANFPLIFKLLKEIGYQGNYIFQTARASDGDHVGVLSQYREKVLAWM